MKTSDSKLSFDERISGYTSRQEPPSDESIVSILVPVAPISDYLPGNRYHEADISVPEPKRIATQRTNQYGEIFNSQAKDIDGVFEPGSGSYTSSTLQVSPTHYISFFSYRISFPFLKFAPKCLPRLPLPGILTTVALLLALIWVAILTIALVELGNYMWKKRQAARLAAESDNIVSERMSTTCKDSKIPLSVVAHQHGSGSEETESYLDMESLDSDFNSDSGSDSEPDVDDYRIF